MQATRTNWLTVTAANRDAAIRRAADLLRGGALVVLPTETVYGLAAHPAADGALERLFAAKGRDPRKPIPLLASDLARVRAHGARFAPGDERLAHRYWPGALTLVLPVSGGGEPPREEGFRVPDHALTLAILRACGGLLRVTSANASGEPSALDAPAAAAALGNAVALILDDGPVRGGVASSVAATRDGRLHLLREGAIAGDALRSVWEGA